MPRPVASSGPTTRGRTPTASPQTGRDSCIVVSRRGGAPVARAGQTRIFMNSRAKLIALDAKTGEPITSFGDKGVVDLTQGLRRPVNPKHYTNTSPPVVYRNLVILGNGVGDRLSYKADPPGDVRAFDARTGKQVWRFHTVPEPGEPGHDTWRDGSWKDAGHTNVWAPMSLDEARGLLYLPVSTPGNDFYGAGRLGANIYGESLVCLDAATGRPRWHFQIVHHGLWDYDLASAPNLVTITVGWPSRRRGRAADQAGICVRLRSGHWAAALADRRAACASERRCRRTGVADPAVSDPACAARRAGRVAGRRVRPHAGAEGRSAGGAAEGTASVRSTRRRRHRARSCGRASSAASTGAARAFDPESGLLYAKVSNNQTCARPDRARPSDRRRGPRAGEVDAEFVGSLGCGTTFTPPAPPGTDPGARMAPLPILKPPYGELVALESDDRRRGLARTGGRSAPRSATIPRSVA